MLMKLPVLINGAPGFHPVTFPSLNSPAFRMSFSAQTMQQSASGTSGNKHKVIQKHDDDVVIVSALRTAITKVCTDDEREIRLTD